MHVCLSADTARVKHNWLYRRGCMPTQGQSCEQLCDCIVLCIVAFLPSTPTRSSVSLQSECCVSHRVAQCPLHQLCVAISSLPYTLHECCWHIVQYNTVLHMPSSSLHIATKPPVSVLCPPTTKDFSSASISKRPSTSSASCGVFSMAHPPLHNA